MSIDYNRIKVADLETNEQNKILITNEDGELEFSDIDDIQVDSYNALDYTDSGKALDARQGKVLNDLKEDKLNKKEVIAGNETSNVFYASIKALVDYLKNGFASALSPKSTTLIDTDLIVTGDSEDNFKTKTRTFAQFKDGFKTYFDTIYLGATNDQTISGVKTFLSGKIGFRNVANTFTSFFSNSNTAARTYTFQNRNGTIADDTDLSTKQNIFYGSANYIAKSLSASTLGNSRLLDTGTSLGIGVINTPLKDISFGNQVAREIGVEDSDSLNNGKDLSIAAGRTINFLTSFIFQPLSQPNRYYTSMFTDSYNNVYVGSYTGSLFKQTNSTGPFVAITGIPTGTGVAGCCAPNGDVYLAAWNGDIYKQAGGVGAWVSQGLPARSWRSMCATPNGDVFASVSAGSAYGGSTGDIYKQIGGAGSFVPLGLPFQNYSLCAMPNNDVYVSVVGGSIYKILANTSVLTDTFQTNRGWYGMATSSSGGDVYACVYSGDIYKQTGGVGSFVATGQTARLYNSIAVSSSLNLYSCVMQGDIYYVNIKSVGNPNLDGGTLKHKSGVGKGTGKSRIEFITGQKTNSGTEMQIETTRAYLDENGYMVWTSMPTYPDNQSAIAAGLPIGCEYKTATGQRMIVY